MVAFSTFACLSLSACLTLPLHSDQGGRIRDGYIDEDGECFPAKLYDATDEIHVGLSISRTLGDLNAAPFGVIPHPQLTYHKVNPNDQYLVLATDGVWTFLESDEVMQTVHRMYKKGKTAQEACKAIISRSALLWQGTRQFD